MRRIFRLLSQPLFYWPVAAILMLMAVRSIEPGAIADTLSARSILLLATASVVNVSALPLWAFRTKRVLASLGYQVSLKDLVLLTSFANVANQALPVATGEVGRGVFLAKLHQIPGSTVAAALVFERVTGFGLMLGTSAAALAMLTIGARGLLTAVLGMAVGLLTLIMVAGRGTRLTDSADGGRVQRVVKQVSRVAGHPKVVAEFAVISLLVYVILAVGFLISAGAVGLDLTLISSWAFHGGGMVVGTLSALPFGLGAADLTIKSLADLQGFDPVNAALAAVAMRLSLTLPLGILGALSYGALSRRLAVQVKTARAGD